MNEVRDCIAQLRYLTSSDAERLSDYKRINLFVRVGAKAAALLEKQHSNYKLGVKRG